VHIGVGSLESENELGENARSLADKNLIFSVKGMNGWYSTDRHMM